MAKPRKTLNKKLDKLWKTVGKEDAYCEICATEPTKFQYKVLHAHHIIGRGHFATRWDLRNRIWVCPTHHTMGDVRVNVEQNIAGWFWGAEDDWLGKHRPADKKYLEKKKNEIKKWSIDELEQMVRDLSGG